MAISLFNQLSKHVQHDILAVTMSQIIKLKVMEVILSIYLIRTHPNFNRNFKQIIQF